MDQGMKENHTATLHPCHGWGPQVQHGHQTLNQMATECISHHYLCFSLENPHSSLVYFTSDMIYSCVSYTGSAEILLGESSAVRIKMFLCCTLCAEALSQPVSVPQPFSLRAGHLFLARSGKQVLSRVQVLVE